MAHANMHDTVSVEPQAVSPEMMPDDAIGAPIQVTSSPTLDGAPPSLETLTPSTAADAVPATDCTPAASDAAPASGIGLEGEQVVWEGRYSFQNFLGRLVLGVGLLAGLIALCVYTWGYDYQALLPLTVMAGLAVIAFWGVLLNRMAHARFGHAYRLTNRRLFVASGLLIRREDQMELGRVKDVFLRQTLTGQWMSIGTVVVVSTERELPVFYITGVKEPRTVMDLIWHHARAERTGGTPAEATA